MHPTAKVSQRIYRPFVCYRNTLVQLLALYTDPESRNAQRYRLTVGHGQTNDRTPMSDHRPTV